MSNAALSVLSARYLTDGTQQPACRTMQTRAELYDVLRYHDYETKAVSLFGKGSS